ncbi:MAG: DUF5654 family protein [Candidatus Paceibacterota bacterium]
MIIKNETSTEVKNQVTSYMAGAFGLVAGLAWNDAIKALIDLLFPLDKSSVWIKFAYAILITIIVVLVTKYIFSSASEKK